MADQPDAMLIVEKGLSSSEPILLSEEIQTLGSSSSSDIHLSNPFVSRSHCQIRAFKGIYLISDLDSKNGTFVNGKAITGSEERELQDGDTVELALNSVRFSFRAVSTDTMTQTVTLTSHQGDLRVDQKSRDVWVRGEQIVPPLAPKDFDVLALLSLRRGEVVSKEDIADGGWAEREGDVGNDEIIQCIHRSRGRIEEDPSNPTLLVTSRGVGYRLM